MADNETLDARLYELAQVCAALKEGQASLHNRLFIDGGGVLPNIYNATKMLEAAINKKADITDVTALAKEVSALKERKIWRGGYIAGAGAILGAGLKWLASNAHWLPKK